MPFDMHRKRRQVPDETLFVEPRVFFDRLILSKNNDQESDDPIIRLALIFGDERRGKSTLRLDLCLVSQFHSFHNHWHTQLITSHDHCVDSFVTGMSDSDIVQCDAMLGIPTNPIFGSLNLAAAVQVIAYDWRIAIGGHDSYDVD